jgi:nitrous oxidase accessory protein NosD
MRLVQRSLAVGIVAAAVLAATSASALGATIDVFPGGSIQAAVNSAHAGDVIVVHPGLYHQSVAIKKNGLTLRGAGPSGAGSVIEPGRHHRCGHGKVGICILHHKTGGGHKAPTAGTRVSGFLVRGFKEFGGGAFGARKTVFRHNKFVNNGSYGVTAFFSSKTRFLHNVAKGAGEAGFYIGDSPHAKAVLRGNRARHNGQFGYLLRDSAHGLAAHNRAVRNCLGIGVLDTGAPGGARKWTLKKNRVLKNKRSCPASDEGSATSGVGIALAGARHTRVQRNVVRGNRPGGPTDFSGGILLVSAKPFGGSNEAHNKIARNRAFGNKPDDILWDGKGKGNKFRHNRCGSSQPGGLCH